MPDGAQPGDTLQVTVPQDVDVLEYRRHGAEALRHVGRVRALGREGTCWVYLPLLLVARVAFVVVISYRRGRGLAADG